MASNPYKDSINSQGKDIADALELIQENIDALDAANQGQHNQIYSIIDGEKTSRQVADGQLQTQIDNIIAGTVIIEEREARIAADEGLQDNIELLATTVAQSIAGEYSERVAADSALQTNITNESSARVAADTTLQNNITAEASARASAISTEAGARSTADSGLQTQINTVAAAPANINSFQTNTYYKQGQACSYGNLIYVSNENQTTGSDIDYSKWTLVGGGGGIILWDKFVKADYGDVITEYGDEFFYVLQSIEKNDYTTFEEARLAGAIRPMSSFYERERISGQRRFTPSTFAYKDSALTYPDFTSLPEPTVNLLFTEYGDTVNVDYKDTGISVVKPAINCQGEGLRWQVIPLYSDRNKRLRIRVNFNNNTNSGDFKLFVYEQYSSGGLSYMKELLLEDVSACPTSQERDFYVYPSLATIYYYVGFHCATTSTSYRSGPYINGIQIKRADDIPPTVRAEYKATNAVVPNSTPTIIQFDTKIEDTHSCFTPGATSKFTAPIAGIYEVSTNTTATLTSTTNGCTFLAIYKNGVMYTQLQRNIFLGNTTGCEFDGTYTLRLAAGDYIQLYCWANNNTSGNYQNRFIAITRIGS